MYYVSWIFGRGKTRTQSCLRMDTIYLSSSFWKTCRDTSTKAGVRVPDPLGRENFRLPFSQWWKSERRQDNFWCLMTSPLKLGNQGPDVATVCWSGDKIWDGKNCHKWSGLGPGLNVWSICLLVLPVVVKSRPMPPHILSDKNDNPGRSGSDRSTGVVKKDRICRM